MTMPDTIMQGKKINTVTLVIKIILSWENKKEKGKRFDLGLGYTSSCRKQNLILATLFVIHADLSA